MHPAAAHLEDFLLVERCLARDATAIETLQESHGPSVLSYLKGRGASEAEARELLADLWADWLVGTADAAAALGRYGGMCSLRTWLNTVALNRLISRKRSEDRWRRLIPAKIDTASGNSGWSGAPQTALEEATRIELSDIDAPLLTLMREALAHALQSCPSERLVTLQLVHGNGVTMREVAQMFGCSESTICRVLNDTRDQIAAETLAYLRRRDPWLEVSWADFLELCRFNEFPDAW